MTLVVGVGCLHDVKCLTSCLLSLQGCVGFSINTQNRPRYGQYHVFTHRQGKAMVIPLLDFTERLFALAIKAKETEAYHVGKVALIAGGFLLQSHTSTFDDMKTWVSENEIAMMTHMMEVG